ncbi:MAG: inositol monophosphatase family protein [Synechococcales cyanobacterium]
MAMQPSQIAWEQRLDVATEAALAAGAILRRYQTQLFTIDEKRPGDLITDADRESEALILHLLERHFPQDAILTEESGTQGAASSDVLWVIDPLDGTTNFAHRYPCFAVSIGLLVEGHPVLGVVYDPSHDQLFRALAGGGATCNRQPMQVSSIATLERSLLVTGFAYDRRHVVDNNYAEFCHFTHLTQGVRRGGSAAMDLAYVACGRLDGYWERGLSPWDITAGTVLVREAGGTVTAYNGEPLDLFSGRIVASNPHLHAAIVAELGRIRPLTWEAPGAWLPG